MATANVGDGGTSGPQAGVDTLQGGDPFGNKAPEIAGLEEALNPVEEVVVVGVPSDAGPASEGQSDQLLILVHRRSEGHRPGEKGRGRLVGQHGCLLFTQREAARDGVVLAIAAHEFRVAPLLDQAPVVPSGDRQLLTGHRTLGSKGLVESQLVPDHHGCTVHGGSEVGHESADQIVERVLVDRHCRTPSVLEGPDATSQSEGRDFGGRDATLRGANPRISENPTHRVGRVIDAEGARSNGLTQMMSERGILGFNPPERVLHPLADGLSGPLRPIAAQP